jgi:hypothetical protein
MLDPDSLLNSLVLKDIGSSIEAPVGPITIVFENMAVPFENCLTVKPKALASVIFIIELFNMMFI